MPHAAVVVVVVTNSISTLEVVKSFLSNYLEQHDQVHVASPVSEATILDMALVLVWDQI